MFRRASALISASLFAAACNGAGGTDEPINLDWSEGQLFHVAAAYRVGTVKNEELPSSLEDGTANFGEQWSDDVVWTYQVVESDFVPEPSDELYQYAVRADGSVAPLAVVRAYIDSTLNVEAEISEADPVIYLVFLADRDRLAAVISFINVDGERIERAWSSTDLGKSYSVLSQSMLTSAPTYLAPFAVTETDAVKVLENGSELETTVVDNGVVEAAYTDELGGGDVISVYEEGQPWPTVTVTDNVDARLLSDAEVESMRRASPWMEPDEPEDFDFRAALSASTDVDAALVLTEEEMASTTLSGSARDGYKPWAGNWWPQKKGALVFGYDGRPTLSNEIREEIDPLKKELDGLSAEIRKLEGEEKNSKVETYREKQDELVTKLVDFYNGVLADLDGGQIRIEDGKISHTEDEWSYDLDKLSPMDKIAVKLYDDGETYPNPFFISAWELLNHYSPAGESWWGHCNGWAAAAILTHEPRESIDITIGGSEVEMTTADIKGLFSETHYSTYSRFYGSRYYKEGDDIADMSPKAFHQLISFYIRDGEVPLVFDTDAGEQVWNFPAYAYDLTLNETTPEGALDLINVNTAGLDALDSLPGIGEALSIRIIQHREAFGPFQAVDDITQVNGIGPATLDGMRDLVSVKPAERTFSVSAAVRFTTDGVDETHVDSGEPQGFTEYWGYTLVTDVNGRVLSGTWNDEKKHPDFAWVPYHNPLGANGNSENPYLKWGALVDVVGEDFIRK